MDYQCEFCGKIVSASNYKIHVNSCILNPNTEKYKNQNKRRFCEKCGKPYTLNVIGSSNRFCSVACRNSRKFSEESKKLKSEANRAFALAHPKNVQKHFCKLCGRPISRYNKTGCCRLHYLSEWNVSEATREKLRLAGKKSAEKQKEERRSEIEKLFFETIRKYFPDAENNKILEDGWDTDVYIPNLKLAIGWNGAVHYFPIYGQKNLNRVQNRDKIKKSLFERKGYKVYIVKDVNTEYPAGIKTMKEKVDFQVDKLLKFVR